MLTIEENLLRLADRGVRLTVKDGALRLKAKQKELVTDKMRQWITNHKEEIVQVLTTSSPAQSEPAPAAAPIASLPVQDQSFADLAYLTMTDSRILAPAEVLQIAITLTNIGVHLSEDGGMVAPIGPFPFKECPTLTKEQVISFVFRHEPQLVTWIRSGRPGATIPQPRMLQPRTPQPHMSHYEAAQQFYTTFCARDGYYLRMRDDGCVGIGVPESMSDEKYAEIVQRVKRLGDDLEQVIRSTQSAGPQRSEAVRTCCLCDLPAEHYSPSGYGYCTTHYQCAGGHPIQWKQHSSGTWVCACVVDRMPVQAVQSQHALV